MLSALFLLTVLAAAPDAGSQPVAPAGIAAAASPLLPRYCVPAPTPSDPGVLRCAGLIGTDVYLAGDEANRRVALGAPAGFPPPLPAPAMLGRTLDWRILGARPIAGIFLYRLTSGDEALRWLVVTKPGSMERPGCIVALFDGNAEPEADVRAASFADARAPGFRCGIDRATIQGRAADTTRRLGAAWLQAAGR
ncbi:hypothetical protein [Aureimonas sp. AU12]|uniref:hypothetical protein n=1 Tax=Aureimonas sp. AU12 TaxID=1638161 RepID=UPI000781F3B0|nr:hypothetical protein [Aureimonas sp. AU12]